MKRFTIAILALAAAVALTAVVAHAAPVHAGAAGMSATSAKPVTLKGEIVDMGCYLGHEAKGEKHKSCATKCISGGMPMGLLTADNRLFLLTLDHDNADPYNQAKTFAGDMVEVTGTMMERGGMRALDVTGVKAAK